MSSNNSYLRKSTFDTKSVSEKEALNGKHVQHSRNENSACIMIKSSKPRGSKQSTSGRSHFRIDWRQLTYFKNQKASIFNLGATKIPTNESDEASSCNSSSASEPGRILNSLDGCFKSGQLSAILGPSGAGKTTFLSALFGNKQREAFGETRVTWLSDKNDPIEQKNLNIQNRKRPIRIAALPQHDHLLHHLTVYESMMFASKIKNASERSHLDDNFHHNNVKRISKMLKLTECLATRCGKLSGGQYKRVSIAQELLSEPDVIILDEPTSGLDAMTCLTTIKTLKSIVMKQPISIILTIHQPDLDVFALFDHVYVIAQGGLAIYEGPPSGIFDAMAQVGLSPPSKNYNPARFIVENAFVPDSSVGEQEDKRTTEKATSVSNSPEPLNSSDEEEDDNEEKLFNQFKQTPQNYIKSSLLSLTGSLSGSLANLNSKPISKDKKPLLNIGIQTLDGKLITAEHLMKQQNELQRSKRLDRLSRLNQIQKSRHSDLNEFGGDLSQGPEFGRESENSSAESSFSRSPDIDMIENSYNEGASLGKNDHSSIDWSGNRDWTSTQLSKAKSLSQVTQLSDENGDLSKFQTPLCMSIESLQNQSDRVSYDPNGHHSGLKNSRERDNRELMVSDRDSRSLVGSSMGDESPSNNNYTTNVDQNSTARATSAFSEATTFENRSPTLFSQESTSGKQRKSFDKRLSAKRNCSRRDDYPTWYHTKLIAHRTWLSIIRDPIFFGIQVILHTTIPMLLATIFGRIQEEGCPKIGGVDLIDFAYSDSDSMIRESMMAVRQSISNIGIMFFEMFVLCFSINCITALVFPMDMHVLIKEYRNGWYSLKAYFLGRTIADTPVPVVLHTLAMAILYFATGQPWSWWRFSSIMVLVILASLISQSAGLAIGAILMKSSQSAVLVAAGLVAPFFALSGFIVRIHTLPLLARMAAQISYLYHLLNGFIVLRYGFGRCHCNEDDFESNPSHEIPQNLRTMASIWVGTYSEEYSNNPVALEATSQYINHHNNSAVNATTLLPSSRSNVDPNIDVVDKIVNTVKMANSFGHRIESCDEMLPYAMLDFNLTDNAVYISAIILVVMLFISRLITFSAIYYKIRSFS